MADEEAQEIVRGSPGRSAPAANPPARVAPVLRRRQTVPADSSGKDRAELLGAGRAEPCPANPIQACLPLKVLPGLPLRQSEPVWRHWFDPTGERGPWRPCWNYPGSAGPCRTSAPRRAARARRDRGASGAAKARRALDVTIPHRSSKGALHLRVPSRASRRNALPGSGQHRHQGRGRRVRSDRGPGRAAKARSAAQAQAWRLEATHSRCRSDRRGMLAGPARPDPRGRGDRRRHRRVAS